MDTSLIITQITVKDKTLVVFYDQLEYGLFNKFSSDNDIRNYINNNLKEAFEESVFKKKNSPYFLNIASVEKLGAFKWEGNKLHLNNLLSIYMPIIQKFIADVLSDSLQVPLDEETNPQRWMRLTSY